MSRTYTNKRTYTRTNTATTTFIRNKATGKVTLEKLTFWQRIKKYIRTLFGTR
jgi:hypothetical protein